MKTQRKTLIHRMADGLFAIRAWVLLFFVLMTAWLAFSAAHLRVDASFKKNIPLEHPYMKTYLKYQKDFGGADRILVAVESKHGDIFTPKFFSVLESVTKEMQSIPGIDPSHVSSIFTPDTRFIEVDEQGFSGGPVIDANFQPDEQGLKKVQSNILKAGIVGRLVANDFNAAMVTAQLLDKDPRTGKPVDYIQLAKELEQRIRQKYQDDDIAIHIIGFAKMIGDVSEGARGVVLFFAIAILVTALLVYWYSKSWLLTLLPLGTSVVAVVWELGLLTQFGFGIDPMSILVPFLVFAIGVSHGVQMINAMSREVSSGVAPLDAAKASFMRLLVPGGVALASDTLGFLTLLLIEIDIIRELAVTASIGVAVIVLTNLVLLPLLLSYVNLGEDYRKKVAKAQAWQDRLWKKLASFGEKKRASRTVLLALLLTIVGVYFAANLKIGDQHAGAPALRPDSVYNQDTKYITEHFSIGVDLISIIVATKKDACIDYRIMSAIDDFHWHMANVDGVQSVISLPEIAKKINAAFNEGYPEWYVLPRNQSLLAQATGRIPTSTGLLNAECSVIPVLVFTKDHKAETIGQVVEAVKAYRDSHPVKDVQFLLASAPVGVLAAQNEAVQAAQKPMLLWVYGVVVLLCLLSFRSVRGTVCVVVPLAVVSVLAQAIMSILHIGLTVATLPVIALGVGVGVDYGIYIFSRMVNFIREGMPIQEAYFRTLRVTGNAVVITGLTLAIGVSTWIFSALQFQADMGVLLTFMFLVNMIGAIVLLPALAALLYRKQH
jgi:hypothetical protein